MRFLILIGVSEENAKRDACEMEHNIDGETFEKLAGFVEFIESAPKNPPFLEHLKYYDDTGKRPKQCRVESEAYK